MPRGKRQKKDEYVFKGFLDVALDAEMKADFRSRKYEAEDLFGELDRLIDDDYKLSVSKNKNGGGTQVFLAVNDPSKEYAGYLLSARGPDSETAVAVLLYKHLIVLEGDWANVIDRGFEPGDDIA